MITTSNKKEIKTASRVNDNDILTAQVEKRACERYPANLQARLFFGNMIYSGMVTNLSKNGMFVSTKVRFPVNSEFMMVVLL
ncbi:MAG: PilZ domain-containing protein, partial [Nitrospirae bacterium]|nr:PilZ domain-containing protein [Nitrospirota bacterium]